MYFGFACWVAVLLFVDVVDDEAVEFVEVVCEFEGLAWFVSASFFSSLTSSTIRAKNLPTFPSFVAPNWIRLEK